jgi:hypothetical protein
VPLVSDLAGSYLTPRPRRELRAIAIEG